MDGRKEQALVSIRDFKKNKTLKSNWPQTLHQWCNYVLTQKNQLWERKDDIFSMTDWLIPTIIHETRAECRINLVYVKSFTNDLQFTQDWSHVWPQFYLFKSFWPTFFHVKYKIYKATSTQKDKKRAFEKAFRLNEEKWTCETHFKKTD